MSAGLEQTPAPPDALELSAPSSADFLYQEPESIEEDSQIFSGGFPRLENGLIDIDVYQDYLPDHPDTIPPIVVQSETKGLRHQHMYFWRNFYRQKNTPRPMRDLSLMNFWRAPYNQILMRLEEEAKIHAKYTSLVSPPPIETMQQSLADFQLLDAIGAAAVGRRVALVPEAFDHLAIQFAPHELALEYSPTELAGIFDEEIEKALNKLKHPQVTPDRVVTGTISRMARLTNNERLIGVARERATEDPIYYPVRIRDPKSSLALSHLLLDKRRLVLVKPLLENEDASLQTGVGEVQ